MRVSRAAAVDPAGQQTEKRLCKIRPMTRMYRCCELAAVLRARLCVSLKAVSSATGWTILFFTLWFFCPIDPASATAEHNLSVNGDLTHGRGNSPDGWRTAAWKKGPDFSVFRWDPSPEPAASFESRGLDRTA